MISSVRKIVNGMNVMVVANLQMFIIDSKCIHGMNCLKLCRNGIECDICLIDRLNGFSICINTCYHKSSNTMLNCRVH